MARRTIKLRRAVFKLAFSIMLVMVLAMPVLADSASVTGSFSVQLEISNVAASDISASGAVISWDTNGSATSQVFYDTVYHDNSTDYAYHTSVDAVLVSHHSTSLTGLTASTTYHYRVKSEATSGGVTFTAISTDSTFTTGASSRGGNIIYPITIPTLTTTTPTTTPTSTPIITTTPITPTSTPTQTTTTTTTGPPPAGEQPVTFVLTDGTTVTVIVDRDNRLLDSYVITSDDGKFRLTFDAGTRITTSTGEIPNRIVINSVPVATMAADGSMIRIYEVIAYIGDTPVHVDFNPPVLLTLRYDANELPGGTTAVYLVYYDENLGNWVRMEPPPGYTEQPGEVATIVSHLSMYGIKAYVTAPPVTPGGFNYAWLWLLVLLLPAVWALWFFLVRRKRQKERE